VVIQGFKDILSLCTMNGESLKPSGESGAPCPSEPDDRYAGQAQQEPPRPSSALAAAGRILSKKEAPEELERLWHHEGMDFSGPGVVDRDGLLFARGNGDNGAGIICLSSESGEMRWEISAQDCCFCGSPIIGDNDELYQGYTDGTLRMLDKKTGKVTRIIKFGDGDVRPFRGRDGRLYIENDSKLYTINNATGRKKLYADFSGKGCSPAVGPDGLLVVVNKEHTVVAIDPKKAQVLWTVTTRGLVRCEVGFGIDGTIYAPNTDAYFAAYDRDTGKEKWKFKTGGYCLVPPVTAGDGTVYLGCTDHTIYAIDPRDGRQVWKQDVGSEIRVQPALRSDGLLGVPTDGKVLYGIEASTGSVIFRQGADAYIPCPPLFGKDGRIHMNCFDRTLQTFQSNYHFARDRAALFTGEQDCGKVSMVDSEPEETFVDIDGMKLKVQEDCGDNQGNEEPDRQGASDQWKISGAL
jgi:outer membrane protein assembly factor BamB